MNAEQARLDAAREQKLPWKKWGPYLSERQWGTVREDYSESGDAWNYFSHDHARSRAYRWGEDGLAGISDDQQLLCFALALWNGEDPILKERLFGLTNSEGNHGEDVKEYYFYLDSTPTHSYLKYLYKYPQAAYPYDNLVCHQPGPQPNRAGIRVARYRCVRGGSLLRRVRRIRQGRPGGHPHPDHRPQPGPEASGASPAAHALVPQHLVLGRGRAPARASSDGLRRGHGVTSGARRPVSLRRGRDRAPVHRERNQHRAPGSRGQPDAVRQGCDPPLHRPRQPEGGEPRTDRDQGRGLLSADRQARCVAYRQAAPQRRSPGQVGAHEGTLRRAVRKRI